MSKIILQGTWDFLHYSFYLWAETTLNNNAYQAHQRKTKKTKKSTNSKQLKASKKQTSNNYASLPHPYTVPTDQLVLLLSSMFEDNFLVRHSEPIEFNLLLPTDDQGPICSPKIMLSLMKQKACEDPSILNINSSLERHLQSWQVPCIRVNNQYLFDLLLSIPIKDDNEDIEIQEIESDIQENASDEKGIIKKFNPSIIGYGNSLRYWITCAKIALECILQDAYFLEIKNTREIHSSKTLVWKAHFSPLIKDQVLLLVGKIPPICRDVPNPDPSNDTILSSLEITENFIHALLDGFIRTNLQETAFTLIESTGKKPKKGAKEFLFWDGISDAIKSENNELQFPEQINKNYLTRFEKWINPENDAISTPDFRTCFKLDPPEQGLDIFLRPSEEPLNTRNDGVPKKKSRKGKKSSLPAEKRNPLMKTFKTDADADAWKILFFLQANNDPSLLVPADMVWRERTSELQFLKRKFENPQERLLTDLGKSCRIFPQIEIALNDKCPTSLTLTPDEAFHFIQETGSLLMTEGFGVIIPADINKPQNKLSVSLRIRPKQLPIVGQNLLSMKSMVEYSWEISLGNEILSEEEFLQLTQLKAPLVLFRGQWVELQNKDIQKILQLLHPDSRKHAKDSNLDAILQNNEMTIEQAMQLVSGFNSMELSVPISSIKGESYLESFFESIRNGAKIPPVQVPTIFQGILRPYQERGLGWMVYFRQFGFGLCLADDMGLGKTIQVIALLLYDKANIDKISNKQDYSVQNLIHATNSAQSSQVLEKKVPNKRKNRSDAKKGKSSPDSNIGTEQIYFATVDFPSLLICPMTILDNWVKEIERFGPSLRVYIHHGKDRLSEQMPISELQKYDLVLTSYALAARDKEVFQAYHWQNIILDEAQNIKNPIAKQTQAIKSFMSDRRLALTGTPVENRLAELWSILDFLNAGYLGSYLEFHQKLAIPIEKYGDPKKKEQLRQIIQPFILRRLKTDTNIIQDLPDKVENKEYCHLSKEQASLYQAVVDEMLGKIGEAEGIQRRGLILASVMKLKQICNHPAQFLHDNSRIPKRSGKFTRLVEMLQDILGLHEKVLIFTQFKEIGFILQDYLQQIFQHEILFLCGDTRKTQRDMMIQRFQEDPHGPMIFILSIKAGGVGLNLTSANNVIHFDRWWNPAVENQATDRVFRIGQVHNVQVWKFICVGTIEEKIDAMIEKKKELANSIITTGENWITELDTTQLQELFRLEQSAVTEEME